MSADKPKSIVQQYVQEQVAKEMEPFYQAFGRGTDKKVASADKSRAARLAEDAPIGDTDNAHRWIQEAAAELRRLEASNDELIEALHGLLMLDEELASDEADNAISSARAAIARAKEGRNG